MSRCIVAPAIRPGRTRRYLPLLLGLLLIFGPLAAQAAPPRRRGAEESAPPLSAREWAAIRALLPESVNGAARPETYFKASNTGQSDNFGFSVAISGNTLVVGAPGEDSAATTINGDQSNNSADGAGAAYVFVRVGTTWTQQAYLKASNAEAADSFGEAVAISGDTIVVSAPNEDSGAAGAPNDNSVTSAGAAYVFVRVGTAWSQQAYLKASNPGNGDFFGRPVAIDGSTIVVGASFEDSGATGVNGNQNDNSLANAGAAYVFVRVGTAWSQQAYIKASNPDANDTFGSSVAVSGDTLVAGALAEDGNGTGQNDNSAADAGAAYVFARAGTSWSQQAYLKAANVDTGDYFGWPAAIAGDTLVVGAAREDGAGGSPGDNSVRDAGAAYVFARSGTTWSQQAYLKAANAGAGDLFGNGVAIDGGRIVVGAPGEASATNDQNDNSAALAGAAYLFERSGAVWTQHSYLKAADPDANDWFGAKVAVSGDTAVVGAPFESSAATGIDGNQFDNSAVRSGSAYSFLVDPAVSIGDATAPEGDAGTRTATFTATLDLPSSRPITVAYAISPGTATAGGDYQPASGTLRFAPGQTVRTLAVTISGDLLEEPDETFSVTLGAPVNAILGDAAGLGTIIDDDARSTIFLPRVHQTITRLLAVINTSAIPISVPAQPGQIFYSTTITVPATLPSGGRFYLSSSPSSAQPALVDDELRMLHGAATIFNFVYSTSRPVPQLVEVPRATLAAVAGQPVTVQFADRYSGEIQATPVYLIWQLP